MTRRSNIRAMKFEWMTGWKAVQWAPLPVAAIPWKSHDSKHLITLLLRDYLTRWS